MRIIGVCVFAGAFAAVLSSPSPSAAFGLRLGPLHIGLPFLGGLPHHRHGAVHAAPHKGALYDKADYDKPAIKPAIGRSAEPVQQAGNNAALLYPGLALPSLYGEIFWPQHAAQWPFDYDAILRSAFIRSPAAANPQACQPSNTANAAIARIRAQTKPTAEQMPLFQKLAEALGMASGYLAQSCPPAIPQDPVARLQLMQTQIQMLSMALDLIRPPLQQFEESLDANQRAPFVALRSPEAPSAALCRTTPAAIEAPIAQIDQGIQPDAGQRDALAELKQAFVSAASDLDAHCPKSAPALPLARLEAMEARLDSSWRALLAMQVALGGFETQLSDAQRSRFDTLTVTAAQ
jgi:LTXXQ motif family protein